MMKGVGKGSPRGISGYSWRNIFWTTVIFQSCWWHDILPSPPPYYCFNPLYIVPSSIFLSLLCGVPVFPTPNPWNLFSSTPKPSTTPHLSLHPLQYYLLFLLLFNLLLPVFNVLASKTQTNHYLQVKYLPSQNIRMTTWPMRQDGGPIK